MIRKMNDVKFSINDGALILDLGNGVLFETLIVTELSIDMNPGQRTGCSLRLLGKMSAAKVGAKAEGRGLNPIE